MVRLDKFLEWILGVREERREMEEAPFYEARLSGWLPRRALMLSVVLHLLAVVLPLPAFLFAPPPQKQASALRIEYDVQWTQSQRLPLIAPKRARRRKPPRPKPKKASPAPAAESYQPQAIVSNPPEPNHPTQTLLTKLDAATVQPADLHLPNMVIPHAPEVNLKPVVRLSPQPMPASLPRLPSPGEIMLAETKLENFRPRLPVRPGSGRDVSAPEVGVGGPEVSRQAVGVPGGLVALSANPAVPTPLLEIPQARLQARFAAGLKLGEGGGGAVEIGAGMGIELPDAYVSGGSGAGVGGLAIVGPAPPPPAAPPPERSREERIQELLAATEGSPRVHSTYLFLSNLTAQSSSWLLRFIEREPGNPAAGEAGQGQGFTAPVVVQKVDPCYPSDAYTERVEGTVLLYGVIGTDGTVEDVTVVRATEERLAERAKDAFARSRFQPARRQGRPIAVDVLVEIPFRLALCF